MGLADINPLLIHPRQPGLVANQVTATYTKWGTPQTTKLKPARGFTGLSEVDSPFCKSNPDVHKRAL